MNRVQGAYDAWHDELEQGQVGIEATPTAPWHLLTIDALPDVRDKRVLEVGCGRGVFSRYLAEQGALVTSADLSPAAVEHARRRVESLGVTTMVADIQSLPFPDESYDIVISQETLEHVPDPDRALTELVRVTALGGKLIVTTPNYLSLMGVARVAVKLTGKEYTELGQPINQPLMLFQRVRALRRLGCRVDSVAGRGQFVPIPRYRTVRLSWLEHPQSIMKWVCYNSLTAATRLERTA